MTGILIVCRNEGHMARVKMAFGMDAKYVTYCAPLLGMRFDTAIVFQPDTESSVEREAIDTYLTEHVTTKLRPGGRMIVV